MGCICGVKKDTDNPLNQMIFNNNTNNKFDSDKTDDKLVFIANKYEFENDKEDTFRGANGEKAKIIYGLIKEINKYRQRHNVIPLENNNEINIIAQRSSDKIAREDVLELSQNIFNGVELGEILFSSEKNIIPKEILQIWYQNDMNNYDYSNENPKPTDFTQILWKNSKYIGIGITKTKKNKIYIVANFYPPGNIKGEFTSNIFPPVKETNEENVQTETTDRYNKFCENALSAHNEYRAKHGSPPLTLNFWLSTLAYDHALLMAKNNMLCHSQNEYNNEKCGENIYCFHCDEGEINGKNISTIWYNEIKNYDFEKSDTENSETNNFSQLIWKDTKEVGFGYSTSKNGIFYIVANYYPSGNIRGKFKENVLPLI